MAKTVTSAPTYDVGAQETTLDTRGNLRVSAVLRSLEYGAFGHYRVNHRCAIVNTQAANSRLFEIRNTHASNLIIPTRLVIQWLQTAAHTAAIEDSIDVYRATGFSVVDTTNTVTPVPTVMRTTGMAASPGGASIRGVTIAGAAAGMTGGTLVKDTSSIGSLPQWLLLAMPTGGTTFAQYLENFMDTLGGSPLILAQNEGLVIENRVLLGAAAGSSVYIDFSYAEVPALPAF